MQVMDNSTDSSRSRSLRPFLFVVLLAIAANAFAQQAPIQQQMTPAQFRAAGLDRLTPEQLANLNAWLDGTIQAETSKAAITAKKEVQAASRGFLNFGSAEPLLSKLSGEFRGFAKGRSYLLDNGQAWQQTDDSTLSGVRLTNPEVRITPSLVGNAWYMQVGKYSTRAKVMRIK